MTVKNVDAECLSLHILGILGRKLANKMFILALVITELTCSMRQSVFLSVRRLFTNIRLTILRPWPHHNLVHGPRQALSETYIHVLHLENLQLLHGNINVTTQLKINAMVTQALSKREPTRINNPRDIAGIERN